MIDIIFKTSAAVNNNRSNFEILAHAMEELGELSQEVIIHEGLSYKPQGKDGIIGEAADAIICIIDLVHRTHPECTIDQINEIVQAKCQKWMQKSKESRS